MTFQLLPKNYNEKIDVKYIIAQYDKTDCFISKTLSISLKKNKSKIELFKSKWDNHKKIVNPYEYIHSIIPGRNCSVSQLNPISRSYYKFVEIYYLFHLKDNLPKEIKTFHLAEGPGGFMEAISDLRNNPEDKYIGMTLLEGNNCPGWKSLEEFLHKYKNIYLEKGKSKTGDLLLPENFEYCFNKYKSSMDIITADGGFDFSHDYNNQELVSTKLIFAEVIYALIMQKKKGCFIIKIYDCFLKLNVDILYLLSRFYKEVSIIKTNSSRCANSERYVVAKYFKYNNVDAYYHCFYNILSNAQNHSSIWSIINCEIPIYFINAVEEINSIMGSTQIDFINKIINSIKNNSNKLSQSNLRKCIYWCEKYNIPYNNIDDLH